MIGKTEENPQLNVFRIPLVNVIHMKHELVELTRRISWKSIEKDFAPYYSDMGRPAVPVRKMVGCMLLKQMYSQSDESFVDRWIENPYLSRCIGTARPIFSLRSHLTRVNLYTSVNVWVQTERRSC